MARRTADVIDRIEPVPPWAGLAWVLPASGGRVVLRGFDETRVVIHEDGMPGSWVLDESRVPLTDAAAKETYGPGGVVYPGDCVVYLSGDERPRPRAWAPERVVAVEAGPQGWQRVWSVCWSDDDWYVDPQKPAGEPRTVVPASAIPRRLRKEPALRGDDRRLVLELFRLNRECPMCGRHGQPIWYQMRIDPMPDVPYRDRPREPGDPFYECDCRATWSVGPHGALLLNEPPLLM